MAPMIRKGSLPEATASGKGASGGSCVRSSWQAKKRRKARRCKVPWSRIAPRSMGYAASRASNTDRWVTAPSTSIGTSWPTWASVRRCCGSSTRIVTGISGAPSLHVGLLHVENFPFVARANPDLSKDALSLRDFAAGFALVLRHVRDQRRIRCNWLYGEVAERVAEQFEV